MNTEPIARRIVERLVEAGYEAYFAGGCVRDRLLQLPSSDYDIATNAAPEEVERLFDHTVPLGIEFGSLIVVIDGLPTEVTTFRSDIHHHYEGGRKPHRIERATAEGDAQRRSFTINGMFFDPIQERLLDFVGGEADLKKGLIRAIGDPDLRFKEDRLRMIRAVRFAARLQFTIEPKTLQAIIGHAHLLFPAVSKERIWQELHKMAAAPHFSSAMRMLEELRLLPEIFPQLRDLPVESIRDELFLKGAPLIALLLPLFRGIGLEERLEMVSRCKPSRSELQELQFLTEAEGRFERGGPSRSIEWARFYAHPKSELAIEIIALRQPDREHFLEEQRRWREELAEPIRRLVEKRPLLTSDRLRAAGISPGPEMGRLLERGEELAVREGLTDPEEVVKRLLGEAPSL